MEIKVKFSQLCFMSILIDMATSLVCWQCVGERCDLDPDDSSNNASKLTCLPGQYCQKVYFEMYSTAYKRNYYSTVRSCAWNCVDQDDFQYCSEALHSSRGCSKRLCCKDADLCNATYTPFVSLYLVLTTWFAVILTT